MVALQLVGHCAVGIRFNEDCAPLLIGLMENRAYTRPPSNWSDTLSDDVIDMIHQEFFAKMLSLDPADRCTATELLEIGKKFGHIVGFLFFLPFCKRLMVWTFHSDQDDAQVKELKRKFGEFDSSVDSKLGNLQTSLNGLNETVNDMKESLDNNLAKIMETLQVII